MCEPLAVASDSAEARHLAAAFLTLLAVEAGLLADGEGEQAPLTWNHQANGMATVHDSASLGVDSDQLQAFWNELPRETAEIPAEIAIAEAFRDNSYLLVGLPARGAGEMAATPIRFGPEDVASPLEVALRTVYFHLNAEGIDVVVRANLLRFRGENMGEATLTAPGQIQVAAAKQVGSGAATAGKLVLKNTAARNSAAATLKKTRDVARNTRRPQDQARAADTLNAYMKTTRTQGQSAAANYVNKQKDAIDGMHRLSKNRPPATP